MHPRILSLQERYPYQFSRVLSHGLSIEPGWIGIVAGVCQQVDTVLEDAEVRKTNFSWLQIKEKFGGLRMYWGRGWNLPVLSDSSCHFEDVGWINFEERVRTEEMEWVTHAIASAITLPENVTQRIGLIIDAARTDAARTCQFCGAPGSEKTLEHSGWLVTACEAHSTREAVIAFRRQEEREGHA